MRKKSLVLSSGNSQVKVDYGRALLSQKGGWTLSEFSRPTHKEGSGFTQADFEEALDKVTEARTPDKAS